MVPAEPLWDIFTRAVIAKLQAVRSPSEYLQCRLAILGAGGLNPSPLNYELRAFKSAWETYLTAAYAISLFDGVHGTDLRARLTDVDDNNHLAAISECFAAWYLAGRRRLPLQPRPAGDQRSCLEFLIEHRDGNINVEVKARCPLIRMNLPRPTLAPAAVDDPERHFATANYRIAIGSLDHLVDGSEQRLRNAQAEGLGGLQVDDQNELGRQHDRGIL